MASYRPRAGTCGRTGSRPGADRAEGPYLINFTAGSFCRPTQARTLKAARCHITFECMKKEQLARRLAKECHVSPAAAADQLDRIVSDLLLRVRRGEPASLPGLGTFQPGSQKEFHFDRDVSASRGRSSNKRSK